MFKFLSRNDKYKTKGTAEHRNSLFCRKLSINDYEERKPRIKGAQLGFDKRDYLNAPQRKNGSSTFRDMFKAASLFGGVQIFNILITIARAKVVAVLLGSAGMGLNGLFLNTTKLITDLTTLGLPQSSVKVIAAANGQGNDREIARAVNSFRKLIWITAIVGVMVMVGLSSKLSQWVFGSDKYTYSFMALSITFIFSALAAGTSTVLQGLRMLRLLAKVNILGLLFGFLASIPFYYLYGIKGVVPALITASFMSMLIARFFEKRIHLLKVNVTWLQAFVTGREMVKLGGILAVSAFMDSGVKLLISAFITRNSTLEVLGFYNAGVSITLGYTGLVFTAMITDYYPRLSEALNRSVTLWRRIVNEQTYLIVLILTPILLTLLTILPWVIQILLTDEFLVISNFVSFLILAIFIQGPVWAMGVIIIAKGDIKAKFYSELGGQIISLISVILLFKFYGLVGAGIGFLIGRIFHLIIGFLISRYRYSFIFDRKVFLITLFSFLTCSILSFVQLKWDYPITHIVGLILLTFSVVYSLYELNNLLDLKRTLNSIVQMAKSKMRN